MVGNSNSDLNLDKINTYNKCCVYNAKSTKSKRNLIFRNFYLVTICIFIQGEILDVDGLNGISLRLVGSEDVDLVGTPFSLCGTGSNDLLLNENNNVNKKRKSSVEDPNHDFLNKKRKPNHPNNVIIKSKPPMMLTPQLMQQRQDVEKICLDLLKRFQHACSLHPKTHAKVCYVL